MLVELRIRDLAIIDEVEIGFSQGLNVLTGETGAGKSIIINAVNMLLGDRSSEGLVRTGAEQGMIEALFDFSKHPRLEEKLKTMGVADAMELLIRRTIARSGRSRVFVNGELSTLANTARIAETLLSIYGQHEHQNLQRAEKHIDILDEYGALRSAREGYEEAYGEMERLRKELIDLKARENQGERDRELMIFQSREIASANLQEGEEEALGRDREILSNAERLFEWTDVAENLLYSGDSSVGEQLDAVLQKVREISKIDSSIEGLSQTVESSIYQLEEVAYTLRNYREKVECDPERLEVVERRLEEIRRLKVKYGQTIQEILEFRDRLNHQLEPLDSNKRRLEKLEVRLADAEEKTVRLAQDLSKERNKIATAFQRVIEQELSSLGMGNTVFEVRIGVAKSAAKEKQVVVKEVPLGPKGMDRVEFFISPNVGEDPRPLSQIASGGELSRIMLAIKRIIASAEPGQTLVFDEVDAGIGGAVAEVVGKKLRNLSRFHQVLCVTHLPQIACFADVHHRVVKKSRQNRTLTEARELNPEERVDEIARMLGGIQITEKTRAHASEMIENAKRQVLNLDEPTAAAGVH
jgi:DNA repair protein RecN (Recombination protein N)